MGKADWCEAYEEMQAEKYGYERAVIDCRNCKQNIR